jgi:hypothetical protein
MVSPPAGARKVYFVSIKDHGLAPVANYISPPAGVLKQLSYKPAQRAILFLATPVTIGMDDNE